MEATSYVVSASRELQLSSSLECALVIRPPAAEVTPMTQPQRAGDHPANLPWRGALKCLRYPRDSEREVALAGSIRRAGKHTPLRSPPQGSKEGDGPSRAAYELRGEHGPIISLSQSRYVARPVRTSYSYKVPSQERHGGGTGMSRQKAWYSSIRIHGQGTPLRTQNRIWLGTEA